MSHVENLDSICDAYSSATMDSQ